jgi:hypothetical protein
VYALTLTAADSRLLQEADAAGGDDEAWTGT